MAGKAAGAAVVAVVSGAADTTVMVAATVTATAVTTRARAVAAMDAHPLQSQTTARVSSLITLFATVAVDITNQAAQKPKPGATAGLRERVSPSSYI